MDYEKRVHAAMREIHKSGLAASAHDVSDGGLAVTLAECATAAIGATVNLDSGLDPAYLLFHEAPSRIVVTTRNRTDVNAICERHGIQCEAIGVTMELIFDVSSRGRKWIECRSADLTSPGLESYIDRA